MSYDPNTYMIAIPSYNRGKLLTQKRCTLSYFSHLTLRHTFLFIRDNETKEYTELIRQFQSMNGVVLMPRDINGIVGTRDLIFDHAASHGFEKLVVMDDDLRFAVRPSLESYYEDQTSREFLNMIRTVVDACSEEHPLIGITARQFSNNKNTYADENTRIIQFYCYHMPTIQKEGLRYSQAGFPYMTDYWFTLKMLTLGYKNLCFNKWTRDDNMQMKGGCSVDRTVGLVNKSAISLCKQFPNFCKPKFKTGGTWNERRIGVTVQWKKAFNEEMYNKRKSESRGE